MERLAKLAPTVLDVPARYGEDLRKRYQAHWRALVMPRTVEEVQAVLAFAADEAIPIVPYGGGTGLVGGQIYPKSDGAICLSLEKMTALEIDGDSVRAGAGVVLDRLHDALAPTRCHFPLHLASSGSAQIGGLIATNAGGVNVIRYGTMGALVLGVEAVLADGTVINRTGNLRKDNTGYALDRLMIGAEGTLGVITKARLATVPRDEARAVLLSPIDSPDAALALLEAARSWPAALSAFELISGQGLHFRALAGFAPAPIGTPDWAVLIELGGSTREVEAALELASDALPEAVLAQSARQIDELWRIREEIPAANRFIGAIASHDIALPIALQPRFIAEMGEILAGFDLRVNVFGHIGDGNLHYNLFPAQGRAKGDYDAPMLSHLVHEKAVEMGGSISAEHGIGRYKAAMMADYGLCAKQSAMRKVKAALDPQNLLNPGVFFDEDH